MGWDGAEECDEHQEANTTPRARRPARAQAPELGWGGERGGGSVGLGTGMGERGEGGEWGWGGGVGGADLSACAYEVADGGDEGTGGVVAGGRGWTQGWSYAWGQAQGAGRARVEEGRAGGGRAVAHAHARHRAALTRGPGCPCESTGVQLALEEGATAQGLVALGLHAQGVGLLPVQARASRPRFAAAWTRPEVDP
ncbi:hypothetical protein C8J57DRAFT_1487256 [Mycena rebaudengoi]|nr:hypothetical protein C8J57DRAFT_1487256 [Mycena rebaudengoi]